MSDHLPECPWIEPIDHGDGSYTEAPCICPALRACEKRVLAGEQVSVAIRAAHDLGRDKGVQAARDAVAAVSNVVDVFGAAYVNRADSLAAIDALRGDT